MTLGFLTYVLFALSSHNEFHIYTFQNQQTEFSQSSLPTLQFNVKYCFLFFFKKSPSILPSL